MYKNKTTNQQAWKSIILFRTFLCQPSKPFFYLLNWCDGSAFSSKKSYVINIQTNISMFISLHTHAKTLKMLSWTCSVTNTASITLADSLLSYTVTVVLTQGRYGLAKTYVRKLSWLLPISILASHSSIHLFIDSWSVSWQEGQKRKEWSYMML